MKNIITILIIVTTTSSYCQVDNSTLIGKYFWNDAIMMEEAEDISGRGTGKYVVSKSGQKFIVISDHPDSLTVTLKVLDYTVKNKDKNDSLNKLYEATGDFYKYNYKGTSSEYKKLSSHDVNSRNYSDSQKYFLVSKSILKAHSTKYTKTRLSLAFGALSFPFKFRIQKNTIDFSSGFNMGAAIGIRLPHYSFREFTHTFLTAYSFSTINIDSTAATRNHDLLTTTNNFSAFTFSLGYMIEYDNIQAGIFVGCDHIGRINQNTYGWIYQSKPWISVGFGYAIFTKEKSKEISDEETN